MYKIDDKRLNRYCLAIRKNTDDINLILNKYQDEDIIKDRFLIKALKYSIIEVSEAMANSLQHLLARIKGEAAESYLELIEKSRKANIIDSDLLGRLGFFFKSRNLIIHRYWEVDDKRIVQETRKGIKDFEEFIKEIKAYINNQR